MCAIFLSALSSLQPSRPARGGSKAGGPSRPDPRLCREWGPWFCGRRDLWGRGVCSGGASTRKKEAPRGARRDFGLKRRPPQPGAGLRRVDKTFAGLGLEVGAKVRTLDHVGPQLAAHHPNSDEDQGEHACHQHPDAEWLKPRSAVEIVGHSDSLAAESQPVESCQRPEPVGIGDITDFHARERTDHSRRS